jgi:hypothetical protein
MLGGWVFVGEGVAIGLASAILAVIGGAQLRPQRGQEQQRQQHQQQRARRWAVVSPGRQRQELVAGPEQRDALDADQQVEQQVAGVGAGQHGPPGPREDVGDAGDQRQRDQAVGGGAVAKAPLQRHADRREQRAYERAGRVDIGREREQQRQRQDGRRRRAEGQRQQRGGDQMEGGSEHGVTR